MLWPAFAVLVACSASTRSEQEAPTDEALRRACSPADVSETPDWDSCATLATRLLGAGRVADAMDPLRIACGEHNQMCVQSGVIYLQGAPGVPPDHDKAWSFMARSYGGANPDYDGAAWLTLRDLTKEDQTFAYRRVPLEHGMDTACRYGHSGWPCFNYGVALTCGFLGEPDVKHARNVLQRGCRLGDGRACDLFSQLDTMAPTLPTCDLIGPDPEVPVKLELHVEPIPEGPIPDTVKPFARKLMP